MRIHAFVLAGLLAPACVVTPERVVDLELVADSSTAQFARMRDLVGTWKGSASAHGEVFPVEIHYRLTAAGSALEETLFPGTEHEMVSMYHRDGPWLMMTHYCTGGNQPRMRAQHTVPAGGEHARISFEFLDATDMASPDERAMHDVHFDLVDRDHMAVTWSSWESGRPVEGAVFTVERVR